MHYPAPHCIVCSKIEHIRGCVMSESRIGTNSGHGHAWARPDGIKARCGGCSICSECAKDKALVDAVTAPAQPTEPAYPEWYGADQAWPLHSVLGKLSEAAGILLDDKNYDGHGHEFIRKAQSRANEIVSAITANPAPQPTESELRAEFETLCMVDLSVDAFSENQGIYEDNYVQSMWVGFLLAHRGGV